MKTIVSSFYMKNTIEYKKLHEETMNFYGININYYSSDDFSSHSSFIDGIMNLNYDLFIFFDIDCIPLSKTIIKDSQKIIEYENDCLIGNLQFTGHARPNKHNLNLGRNHNYCAPSFLCITKNMYEKIGKPPANGIRKSTDPAQVFSVECDKQGLNRKMLLPTKVIHPKWSNEKYIIGIGTYYTLNYNNISLKTYHHFEARKKSVKDFKNITMEIIK